VTVPKEAATRKLPRPVETLVAETVPGCGVQRVGCFGVARPR
jgi:hypothetical protein